MISVIALDPEWHGGRYTHNPVEGLRLAGMLYYPWVVSASYLDRLPAKTLAKEVDEAPAPLAIGTPTRWSCAMPPAARTTSRRLSAATWPQRSRRSPRRLSILPSATDRLLGIDGARRIRDGVKSATYAEIPTDLGHRAARPAPGTPETDFIDRQIRAFLARIE